MISRKTGFWSLAVLVCLVPGCGYTRKTVLPKDIRTIYVETVQNKIPLKDMYAYAPGLEMMITNAVVRRLNEDGNLKVVPKEKADAILQTDLTAFEQGGVRFSSLESVDEYRLFIVVHAKLVDSKANAVIWDEPNFSGDTEYFVSKVRSIAREEAAERAVNRLAVNLVDRIVEDW